MTKQSDKTLYDALALSGLLAKENMDTYLKTIQLTEESLDAYLLRNGFVTKKQVLSVLGQVCKLETIDLQSLRIDQSVVNKIPVKIAWYYHFMPLHLEQRVLTAAISSPMDIKLQDEIRLHLGFEPKFVLATEKDLMDALKKYYGLAADMIDRILTKEPDRKVLSDEAQSKQVEELDQKGTDASVGKLVNQIILEAYRKRATDIHIEPYRDKVRFRYRIDGALVDANLPTDVKHFMLAIISRIKIMSNLSIVEKRIPQDGSATVKVQDQNLDLRVSTIPTPQGESIVIRILPTKVMKFKLEALGLDGENLETFRSLIRKPHGVLFVTGPTGSGKTTTLYACLHEINSVERKIVTIEDPVEYEMESITQIQVNPKIGLTFASGLRSVLRHDPDIIMVGEVRDLETAEIAIRTALTGHLVFSTLHTNDAASGVTRLIEMNIEPYLVSSSVEGFVAQRLVRVICENCKHEAPCSEELKAEIAFEMKIDDPSQVKVFEGKGCDRCNNTGYYGRTAIYEILMINDPIRKAIFDRAQAEAIKKIALAHGMRTLRQDGWRRVLQGITTPAEVVNTTTREHFFQPTTMPTQLKAFESSRGKPQDVPASSDAYRIVSRNVIEGKSRDDRVYPRVDEKLEVLYRLFQSNPDEMVIHTSDIQFASTTKNIGAGGVVVYSEKPLAVGAVIEIRIYLDSKKKESVECLAKVCRVEKEREGEHYHVVVYFLDISSADRNKLMHFVNERIKVLPKQ